MGFSPIAVASASTRGPWVGAAQLMKKEKKICTNRSSLNPFFKK
jgi:hypothetical protein